MVNTSSEGFAPSETRFVLAPSCIRTDFFGSQGVDMQKIRAAISDWPQSLPRIEMVVADNKASDIVTGGLIFVHPGGLVSEPLLRIQVDGLLEPTMENAKHRRMSSALQTASLRGSLSDNGMKDLAKQVAQAGQLQPGRGTLISLAPDGGVALGQQVALPTQYTEVEKP